MTNGKVVVVVNGGKPRTLRAGESVHEVKLISADTEAAVVEINGKRRTLTLGQTISTASPPDQTSAMLNANANGHFISSGSINGAPVKFLVDTGATLVAISLQEARRIGINYLKGERGLVNTANGAAEVYLVKFDTVKIGDLTLNNVDGMVINSDMPYALLGMSFLSRVEMKREGMNMMLIKRY